MTTTPTLPRIKCPTWCRISEAEHQADLDNWEGRCIHHSEDTTDGWSIVATTSVDGQPWADLSEHQIGLFAGNDAVVSLEEAESRANEILELVRRARA